MPAESYYAILEITQNATPNEIKKAYRKAALKWHPDKNLNQKEVAEARFKQIGAAYDVLGDPEKKARYDRDGVADTSYEEPKTATQKEYKPEPLNADLQNIKDTLQKPKNEDYKKLFESPLDLHRFINSYLTAAEAELFLKNIVKFKVELSKTQDVNLQQAVNLERFVSTPNSAVTIAIIRDLEFLHASGYGFRPRIDQYRDMIAERLISNMSVALYKRAQSFNLLLFTPSQRVNFFDALVAKPLTASDALELIQYSGAEIRGYTHDDIAQYIEENSESTDLIARNNAQLLLLTALSQNINFSVQRIKSDKTIFLADKQWLSQRISDGVDTAFDQLALLAKSSVILELEENSSNNTQAADLILLKHYNALRSDDRVAQYLFRRATNSNVLVGGYNISLTQFQKLSGYLEDRNKWTSENNSNWSSNKLSDCKIHYFNSLPDADKPKVIADIVKNTKNFISPSDTGLISNQLSNNKNPALYENTLANVMGPAPKFAGKQYESLKTEVTSYLVESRMTKSNKSLALAHMLNDFIISKNNAPLTNADKITLYFMIDNYMKKHSKNFWGNERTLATGLKELHGQLQNDVRPTGALKLAQVVEPNLNSDLKTKYNTKLAAPAGPPVNNASKLN